jgi:hypothetical protein
MMDEIDRNCLGQLLSVLPIAEQDSDAVEDTR